MEFSKQITICEVGVRDGFQNERVILSTDKKVRLINSLTKAGYKIIEVGSFVSPKAVPQMANTDEVFRLIERDERTEYRALIANIKGVERARDCGCKKVKLNVSASRAHNLANLNRTPEETVQGFVDCIALAKENDIEISGSISMPFGSPWEKEIPFAHVDQIIQKYYDLGIRELSLSDAAGVAYPSQVYEMSKLVREKYPDVKWILHFHNTRGLAMANILAGMQAGMTIFDSAFAGLGGCPFVPGAAGNICSEDVLHMMEQMGIETGVDLDKAIEIAKKAVEYVGHPTDSYLLRAGKSRDLCQELPRGQNRYVK